MARVDRRGWTPCSACPARRPVRGSVSPSAQSPRISSTKPHADRRGERARRLERDALRGQVRPGVADAHVDDPAHIAGREEQQVVERYRRRVTDDVDPRSRGASVSVPARTAALIASISAQLLVEPAVGDRLDDMEILAVRPGPVVGRLGHGPDDPDLIRSPGNRLAQVRRPSSTPRRCTSCRPVSTAGNQIGRAKQALNRSGLRATSPRCVSNSLSVKLKTLYIARDRAVVDPSKSTPHTGSWRISRSNVSKPRQPPRQPGSGTAAGAS